MTVPADPKAVVARIKAETGIDLLDTAADAAAASAATRRSVRQTLGTIGCGILGAVALLLLVLAVAPGDAEIGVRVAFAVVGVAFAAAAIALGVWAWRTPAAYTQLYLARQAAQQRFFTEIGQPYPSPFSAGDWLSRKALIAYSTPGEVRQMRRDAEGEAQHGPVDEPQTGADSEGR